MKTFLAALACVLLLWTAPTHGDTDFVWGNVDIPASNPTVTASVHYGDLVFAGWAFDCDTGAIPESALVVLFGLDGQGYMVEDTTVIQPFSRPDVYAMFHGACPALTNNTGYYLLVWNQPPPGRWMALIVWAEAPGVQYSEYRYFTVWQ